MTGASFNSDELNVTPPTLLEDNPLLSYRKDWNHWRVIDRDCSSSRAASSKKKLKKEKEKKNITPGSFNRTSAQLLHAAGGGEVAAVLGASHCLSDIA